MKLRLSIASVLSFVALGLVATGAAGQSQNAAPYILTVALGGDTNLPAAAVQFADSVRRLSSGDVAITYRSVPPGGLTADSERLAIQEVRDGSTPMAWIPTPDVPVLYPRLVVCLQN
jgi:TRAP-type C4-dicarboxylate transport system substrate-binding protein